MTPRSASLAGRLLFRHLPEDYRYRDTAVDGEPGDLEAYLDAMGQVLDRVRATIEQLHADSFAEPLLAPDWYLPLLRQEPGKALDPEIAPQPWILPYLAELIGAQLLAPDAAARTRELNQTARWYKSKGTLASIDGIADTLAGAETVIVEGWQRMLVTPRPGLPPFSASPGAGLDAPLGTPDLRRAMRAVRDAGGSSALARFTPPGGAAPLHFRIHNRRGVPCFPGSYEDRSARTPDLRPAGHGGHGPHPRQVQIFVQPPPGFFEPGLREVAIPAGGDLGLSGEAGSLGPREVLLALGGDVSSVPDKLVVRGDLTLPAGVTVSFSGLLFLGRISVPPGARLGLTRCAAAAISLGAAAEQPSLDARDCLIGEIFAPNGFARLEFVTVLQASHIAMLQASECIFAAALEDFACGGPLSCLRYSHTLHKPPSLDPLKSCGETLSFGPVGFFARHVPEPGGGCALRIPRFGETGCGVVAHDADRALLAGGEDGGELGACHHLHHAAALGALARKLAGFIPVGIEPVILYDRRLAVAPPELKGVGP